MGKVGTEEVEDWRCGFEIGVVCDVDYVSGPFSVQSGEKGGYSLLKLFFLAFRGVGRKGVVGERVFSRQ